MGLMSCFPMSRRASSLLYAHRPTASLCPSLPTMFTISPSSNSPSTAVTPTMSRLAAASPVRASRALSLMCMTPFAKLSLWASHFFHSRHALRVGCECRVRNEFGLRDQFFKYVFAFAVGNNHAYSFVCNLACYSAFCGHSSASGTASGRADVLSHVIAGTYRRYDRGTVASRFACIYAVNIA